MPTSHTVKPGECIASIAAAEGFFPDTIWDHPDNAELAAARESPYVLQPGDVVVVPDLRDKQVAVGMDQRHVFRRKGVPEKLELVLCSGGQARANVAFVLEIAGRIIEGATTEEGKIDQFILPNATRARLELETGEVYVIALGHLDPASTPDGARARLRNLGLLEPGDNSDDGLYDALLRFQTRHELASDGVLDEATQAALIEAHGA